MVRVLDLWLKTSQVRISAVLLSANNLGQVVHTRVPLLPSSITWYHWRGGDALRLGKWLILCLASHLAMRHRLQWFIHLQVHGLRKADEHPAYTPHGVQHSFFISVSGFFAPPCIYSDCYQWLSGWLDGRWAAGGAMQSRATVGL